jgi:exonuclease SbcD
MSTGMRVLHTADWHLGHTLSGHTRSREHEAFLAFLLDRLTDLEIDALVVAGDVYDHGHPSAAAMRQFFGFVAEARRRRPALDIVVIGGNHDTAARLDAAAPILSALNVTILGGLPRHEGGRALHLERTIVPLHHGGDVAAVAIAVPFLRAPELSLLGSGDNLVQHGSRVVVERAVEQARVRFPAAPIIAIAHCELAGAALSSSSERPLFGGQHALPADLFFQAGVDYAALGHLHLAQQLGPEGRAAYSGSPIPLSMAERHYQHRVVVVELGTTAGAPLRVQPVYVPRTVDFLRVPDDGAGPLDEVLDRLAALDLPARPLNERPFLEVRVRLDRPVSDLRMRVERALEGKDVRLVRVERESLGEGLALPDVVAATHTQAGLLDLSPAAVFSALYARRYGGEAPADVMSAFLSLVHDDVREHARDGEVG